MAGPLEARRGCSPGRFSRPRLTRRASLRSMGCLNGFSAPNGTGAISTSTVTCRRLTRSWDPSYLNGAVTGEFTRFKARGGKLIIFQGWADPIVAPYQTVALYEKLTRERRPRSGFRPAVHGPWPHTLRPRWHRLEWFRIRRNRACCLRPRTTRATTCSSHSAPGSKIRKPRPRSSPPAMWTIKKTRLEGNRNAAAALPIPAEGLVQGGRRSERRQQLCLREQAALTEVTTTEVERYPRHPQ